MITPESDINDLLKWMQENCRYLKLTYHDDLWECAWNDKNPENKKHYFGIEPTFQDAIKMCYAMIYYIKQVN